MKFNLKTFIVIGVLVIILIVVLRKCGYTPPSHDQDKKELDSIQKKLNQSELEMKRINDSLHQIQAEAENNINQLKDKVTQQDQIAAAHKWQISQILNERDQYKKLADTLRIIRNCDTVAELLVTTASALDDCLNTSKDLIYNDSIARNALQQQYKITDSLRRFSSTAFDICKMKYDALLADYNKSLRGKLFVGVTVGSDGRFLDAGPSLTWLTRGQKLYGAHVGYSTQGGLFYQVSLGWKIHL